MLLIGAFAAATGSRSYVGVDAYCGGALKDASPYHADQPTISAAKTQVQTGTGPLDSARIGSNGSFAPNALISSSTLPPIRSSGAQAGHGDAGAVLHDERDGSAPDVAAGIVREQTQHVRPVVERRRVERQHPRRDDRLERFGRIVEVHVDARDVLIAEEVLHQRSSRKMTFLG